MVNEEKFEKFLEKQKINAKLWKEKSPADFNKHLREFNYLGEKSFYERKRFYINKWRSKYPLSK